MWRRDRLLFVSQDCCGFALAEIKSLMEAGASRVDLRSTLYVVDMVLKRAEVSQVRSRDDPLADQMRQSFLPYLSDWLRQYLAAPRKQSSLQKLRHLAQRWREQGYLSVEALAPLLDQLQGDGSDSQGALQDSQSSQTSGPAGALRPGAEQPPTRGEDSRTSLSRTSLGSRAASVPAASGERHAETPVARRKSASGRQSTQPKPLDAQAREEAARQGYRLFGPGSKRPRSPRSPRSSSPPPSRRLVLPSGTTETTETGGDASRASASPATSPGVAAQSAQSAQSAPSPAAAAPPIWPVLGDCRCLFRAVIRSKYLDPCNHLDRDQRGEPVEEQHKTQEREKADVLRLRLCNHLRERKEEVLALLEHPLKTVDEYITGLEDWRTWGDEICLKFLPDLIQCPIQVYSWNNEQQNFFDAGMYLPGDKEKHKNACIVLWYNGKSHYDLVSTQWLRAREQALIEALT
ncbi:unnamed protein product [Durusdinium trenchii]